MFSKNVICNSFLVLGVILFIFIIIIFLNCFSCIFCASIYGVNMPEWERVRERVWVSKQKQWGIVTWIIQRRSVLYDKLCTNLRVFCDFYECLHDSHCKKTTCTFGNGKEKEGSVTVSLFMLKTLACMLTAHQWADVSGLVQIWKSVVFSWKTLRGQPRLSYSNYQGFTPVALWQRGRTRLFGFCWSAAALWVLTFEYTLLKK